MRLRAESGNGGAAREGADGLTWAEIRGQTWGDEATRPPRAGFIRRTWDNMSMFFFRLHNLRRADDARRANRPPPQQAGRGGQQGARGGAQANRGGPRRARPFRQMDTLTLGPSRLFERTPLHPSDSMDEIAQMIPRFVDFFIITWSTCHNLSSKWRIQRY